MSKLIDILVVEPGKAPHLARVEDTLEKMADMVGGQPEIGCFLPQRVLMVYREDITGLIPNRRNPATGELISGPFLLCRFDDAGFASLTPDQQQEFRRCFTQPDEFLLACTTPNELLLESCKLWGSSGTAE